MSKINDTENIVVLGAILLLITALAGALLGFVNNVTEEPIRLQEEKAKNEAYRLVLAEADAFTSVEYSQETYPNIQAIASANNDAGYVMEAVTKGYGGTIKVVVGMTKEGQLSGIQMLTHAETPGLGANANEDYFKDRFKGKGPETLEVSKTSNEENNVEAITGATITSKALVNAANDALKAYKDLLAGGGQ